MKFSVNRSELTLGVNTVCKAISNRTTLPVLENLYLELDNNKIVMRGNDLELGIEYILPVNVIEDPVSNDNRQDEEKSALQQDNLATTQAAGPSGAKGELDIEGEIVNYWKPMDGLYELWIDNQLIGFTEMEEIELAQANTSFADQLKASRVRYSSELLVPNRKQAEHDKFEIGLRWVYRQYLDASK